MKQAKWLWGILLFLFLAVAFYYIALWTYGSWPGFVTALDNAGIVVSYLLGIFSITIGVLNFNAIYKLLRKIPTILKRGKNKSIGEPFDIPPDKIKAVILPVSKRPVPGYILNFLEPKYVSFIYTDSEESIKAVKELMQDYKNVEFFPSVAQVENNIGQLLDYTDVKTCKDLAVLYIKHYLDQGIPRNEIFIDTTGGSVPMSIGCYQAAEENNVSSFYIIGKGKNNWVYEDDKHSGYTIFMADHSEEQTDIK